MTRENFVKTMTALRALYPQRVADADHWRAMIAGYHAVLGDRDDALIADTFSRAWREFPSFFPSAGELAELATRVAKRRLQNGGTRQLAEGAWRDRPEAKAAIEAVKSIR